MCSERTLILEVSGIKKSYPRVSSPARRLLQLIWPREQSDDLEVLRDVGFCLARGETLAIIGRNGAGKSTLLQIICGTLQPSKGAVCAHGKIAALLELGAGFNPDFTGRENIYLNAALHGLTRAQIDARLDDILAFADIGEYIDQPLRTYSSGMQVRLAFSAITHVDADILIIDEALAVGDAFFVQKCMRFLREFQQRGSILFVSHDSSAVTALCNRALWLDNGRVRMLDSAKVVCEAYLADQFGEQVEAGSGGFGQGGARIENVRLSISGGEELKLYQGEELVRLTVQLQALRDIDSPIVGFYVKDRLGQTLFGENTCQVENYTELRLAAGGRLLVSFEFEMPRLQTGDYTVAVAVAAGTQKEHVQHHWVHDALVFHVSQSSGATGLVGIPMKQIQIKPVAA